MMGGFGGGARARVRVCGRVNLSMTVTSSSTTTLANRYDPAHRRAGPGHSGPE